MDENASIVRHPVYIVDDDRPVLDLLTAQISAAGFDAVGFDSAASFLRSLKPRARGCLLVDFRMPDMTGKQLQEVLVGRKVIMPIIFLTGTRDVSTTAAVMKLGAVDVIEKPWEESTLMTAVQAALKLEEARYQKSLHIEELLARMAELTPRELEVAGLVVGGSSNKTIATTLAVSERTVEVHRARVMSKMKADGLAHLVVMWREAMEGLGRAAAPSPKT
jgi:FixJ family two-component response regulator